MFDLSKKYNRPGKIEVIGIVVGTIAIFFINLMLFNATTICGDGYTSEELFEKRHITMEELVQECNDRMNQSYIIVTILCICLVIFTLHISCSIIEEEKE